MTERLSDEERAETQARMEANLAKTETSSEIERQRGEVNFVRFQNDTELADTFEDALAQYQEATGLAPDAADSDNMGDGYEEVDKEELLNMPLLLQIWEMDSGSNRIAAEDGVEYGFLIVRGITKTNRRVRFTAGVRNGLGADLVRLTKQRAKAGHPAPNAGLVLLKGLDRAETAHGTYIYRAKL